MAKTLNLVLFYTGTDFCINDRGPDKSPRFELINQHTQKVIKKSNNPMDFDTYVIKQRGE